MEKNKIELEVKDGVSELKIIEQPCQEKKIHNWNPRGYSLQSTQSVIDLVLKKSVPENAILFFNESNISCVLDDKITDRPLDKVTYDFKESPDLADWGGIFNKKLAQKNLINFFKRLPDDVEIEPSKDSLIASFSNMKFVTNIVGDASYDDNDNLSFMFKSSDGEGCCKIPHYAYIKMPLINGSKFEPVVELEIEVNRPKNEGDKVSVVISCPKLSRYWRDAVDEEVKVLKEGLKDFLILEGQEK